MSQKTNQLINVAVPVEAHREMKREADARGMKLRAFQLYLLNLARHSTPEQQRAAYEDFVRREKQSA